MTDRSPRTPRCAHGKTANEWCVDCHREHLMEKLAAEELPAAPPVVDDAVIKDSYVMVPKDLHCHKCGAAEPWKGPVKGCPICADRSPRTPPAREWISCATALPPNGEVVDTKIDDKYGCRNEQTLKRQNALWFYPDASMYVYYTPTHWRSL